MLDEMNPRLEKLAEEPYEKIREYELKVRKLKEGDFGLENLLGIRRGESDSGLEIKN